MPTGDDFVQIEEAVRSGGAGAAFELLIDRFLKERDHPRLFEARLMQARHRLGMPLLWRDSTNDLPEAQRALYEEACVEAAREAGGLFLADGDIARAWPYYRALGDVRPIVDAIERAAPGEGCEGIIEVAYQEGVAPRKGFELMLAQHGVCRAITAFAQYPGREGRAESLALLVRTLHAELVDNLKRAIASAEGGAPDTTHVPTLMEGRDWLFGDYNYYVDTSHVLSILQLSLDTEDHSVLAMSLEIALYAQRLAPMFHFRGEPPFESYEDYSVYLRALLGEQVDVAVERFRGKAASGSGPAQVLVGLLARLGRHEEAIDATMEFLADADPRYLVCPPLSDLCRMAGAHDRWKQHARQRGDLLGFVAGLVEAHR